MHKTCVWQIVAVHFVARRVTATGNWTLKSVLQFSNATLAQTSSSHLPPFSRLAVLSRVSLFSAHAFILISIFFLILFFFLVFCFCFSCCMNYYWRFRQTGCTGFVVALMLLLLCGFCKENALPFFSFVFFFCCFQFLSYVGKGQRSPG